MVSSRAESKPVPKFRKKENGYCGVGGGCVYVVGCRQDVAVREWGERVKVSGVVWLACSVCLSDGWTLRQGKVGLAWTERVPSHFFFFLLSPAIYLPFLSPGAGLGGTCFSITNLS